MPWHCVQPRMSTRTALTSLAVAFAAAALTACAGSAGSPPTADEEPVDEAASPSPDTSDDRPSATASELTGQFTSVAVTGATLVDGTQVVLTFDGNGRVSAIAGCNTLSGSYTVEDEQLVVGEELAMTRMACSPELMDQDTWLAELLTSNPTIVVDGDTLTLTADDVTLELRAS